MKIAIVDDNAKERNELRKNLEYYLDQYRVSAKYYEYSNGEAFLNDAQNQSFTVVFLDIYMNGANGIEIARSFRRFDTACLLVFITTSMDHALEGFQVRALHYLVKPFSNNALGQLIREIMDRIPEDDPFIDIKTRGHEIRLIYSDIVYAEHFSHLIYVHTAVKTVITTRQSFREFIIPLKEDSRFFICSRGVIVNLEHAYDFEERSFIMDEGSRVLVNRDLEKEARKTLMTYLLHQRRRY